VTVLRCAFIFSPVACRDAPNGLDAASTVYGKTAFFQTCWNPLAAILTRRQELLTKQAQIKRQ